MKTLTTMLGVAVVVLGMSTTSQADDNTSTVTAQSEAGRIGWVTPPNDRLPEPVAFKPQ